MNADEIQDFLGGLQDMVTFFTNHPDLIDKAGPVRLYISVYNYDDNPAKPQVQELARKLAPCEKNYEGEYFELNRQFGPHRIQVFTQRENVCEKVVVGTRTEQRYTYSPEDQAKINQMERSYQEVEVEDVKWVCPPSLLGD